MGGGASSLPMYIDKETFRHLSGGTLNDAIFDANAEGGVLTRDRLLELSQMRDCFLSHNMGLDTSGRDVLSTVEKITQALRGKGLLVWRKDMAAIPPNQLFKSSPAADLIQTMCQGIDKSRSFVCFLTRNYIQRVSKNNTMDLCSLEFHYTLRRKHPSRMVAIVLEKEIVDKTTWGTTVGMSLAACDCLDFSDDSNFEAKVDQLYQFITKISKSGEKLFAPETAQHNTILSQVNKTKEEQQFFQWLTRSTDIDESNRIIYCSTFVSSGISNVFSLAKVMKQNPDFLLSAGVTERDADQIALCIRDLGLGYVPVKNFGNANTMESVVFAMQKARNSPEDPELAEGALKCLARVASSHPIMPQMLNDAGMSEACLKLMQRHLGHGPTQEFGSLALHCLSTGNDAMIARLGAITACDSLPRSLRSHCENPQVVYHACNTIATLATNKDNRQTFANTGACDVIVKSMNKCMAYPEVIERAAQAANNLTYMMLENVGRFGIAGICQAINIALDTHAADPAVVGQLYTLISHICVEPTNRNQLGELPNCMAIEKSLRLQIENDQLVAMGCNAIFDIILGNAYIRTQMAKAMVCEVVAEILHRHYQHPHVAEAASKAIFSLAAGSMDARTKFDASVKNIVTGIMNDRNMPEKARKEAKEAYLQI